MAKKKVLVLRTCRADMSSSFGFVWPESGYVEAPDWKPTDECGNGLHGWLWGEGSGGLGNWEHDAKWLVVKVDADRVIDLEGKVKFPSGEVVFCGSRLDATNYLVKRAPGKAVIGATVVVGDRGTAMAGDYGTAMAGDYGMATVGHHGTATAGDYGMATAGSYGTATAGDRGTATAGHQGTVTAGERGKATAGDGGTTMAGREGTAMAGREGTATAGDYGTATVEDLGKATAGEWGKATAGYGGKATAGYGGILCLKHFDGERWRIKTAYVGEDGIRPNVGYVLDDGGNFVEVNK